MEVVKSIKEIRTRVREWKAMGYSVGFVPTMGFLHEGHGSLIERANKENDKVVVSIFVNPTQFNNAKDLETYPRNMEADTKLVSEKGGDVIFAPEVEEMYGSKAYTIVDTSVLDKNLCGATRPGHFRGVCTVVSKLFNIVAPHKAYFGKKDYQQLAIIKKMVEDLNIDVEVVGCEIVRSEKGLALSSRNSLLNEEELDDALVLSKSIGLVESMVEEGVTSTGELLQAAREMIGKGEGSKIDYINIVDQETLEDIDEIKDRALIAMAVSIGNVRLIDNRELYL